MPFPTALQTGDYTNLRKSGHKSNQYLVLGSNTTVFAARVNQASFASSFGQITFDTVTTGAYTDILEGMTVLISSTNDKRAAYFVGRVRADNSGVVATSTVLNVNETSAAIADNDYIFVIRDYRLFHELGRYTGGVYYKDYARTFSQLKPIIYGLQSAYAGVVSGSPSGFTVAFAASAVAATSGATISSYAYTLPSGTTVTAGNVSTANVTVRFDASATEYWVKLVVTDSGGRTQTRYIPVFAVPSDLSTTVYLGTNGANITGDIDNGYSATIDVFTGFSSVLDNTLAVLFDVEYYGTTQTSIVSSVKFVGRMRSETDPTQVSETISVSRKASVDIEGAAAQMARITTPLITMRDKSSATVWDEIVKLTVWRAVTYLLEHSTFHQLYSLSFDSTADTYLAYQLAAAQGNLQSSTNDLLKAINAALEFAPTGEVRAVRNLNFLSSAERSALTTVANFETQDFINVTPDHQHVDTIGLVEASGGTYNRSGGIVAAMVTPFLSVAPGIAQGNAEGTSPLPGQVLQANVAASVARSELNARAANQYAFSDGNDELNIDFRTGYNWITPSRYQYYTFTIAATDNTFGRAYTTSNKFWCKSVDIRHDNATGKKEVSGVFVLETSGGDAGIVGQNVPIPAQSSIPPVLPVIPPIIAYPYFPPDPGIYLPSDPLPSEIPPYITPPATVGGVPVDGNAVVYWSASHVWYSTNFLGLNTSVDITPPNALSTIKDVALVGQRIYVVSSNGTDNALVHSAPNAFTASPVYTDSASLSNVYFAVRPTSTDGAVYVEGFTTGATNPADRWDTAFATSTILSRTATTVTVQAFHNTLGDNKWYAGVNTGSNNICGSYLGYTAFLTSDNSPLTLDFVGAIACGDPVDTTYSFSIVPPVCVNSVVAGKNSGWTDPFYVVFEFADDPGCGDPIPDSLVTRYSTDYGATFASPVSVGTAPNGTSGMDTIKIGVPVLVGKDTQTVIATSAGGAYTDYGSANPTNMDANSIVIPRYQFGSTTTGNVSTTTPQYLMGSSTLGTGNKTVEKVTASGATFTDITPSNGGNYGLVICPRSLAMPWWSGSRIAAVLLFGSLPRLMVSTNAGSAWTDRGVLSTNATMCVYRRGDKTMQQLFLTNGGPAYSPDHGATVVTKSFPGDSATEPIIGIEPYG